MCSNREKAALHNSSYGFKKNSDGVLLDAGDSGFESFHDSSGSTQQSSTHDGSPALQSICLLSPISSRRAGLTALSVSTSFAEYMRDCETSAALCSSTSNTTGTSQSPRRTQNRIDLRRNLNACKRPSSTLLTFDEDERDQSSPPRRTSNFYTTAWNAADKRRRHGGVGALFIENKNNSAGSAAHAQKYIRHFYNGVERLDIITMLESLPVVMDNILEQLDAQTLRTMTSVSARWRYVVNSSSKASVRLQRYNFESLCCKENNVKQCAIKRDNSIRFSRAPLNNYNRENESQDGRDCTHADHQKAAIDEAPVNCPLCGSSIKIRRISDNEEEEHIVTEPKANDQNFNNSCSAPPNTTFMALSAEAQQLRLGRCTHAIEAKDAAYGQCMGLLCKYKFCLKCRHPYNRVEKGRSIVYRTPSKIKLHAGREQGGMPIRRKNQRKSLRRLCF